MDGPPVAASVAWRFGTSMALAIEAAFARCREVEGGFGGPALDSTLEERTKMSTASGECDGDLGGGITVISCLYHIHVCISSALFLNGEVRLKRRSKKK